MSIEHFARQSHRLLRYNLLNFTSYNVVSAEKSKLLHTTPELKQEVGSERNFPIVYYYQNPLQWLKIKWQLLKLRKWDKEFNQEEFSKGSSYAISSITHKIKVENFKELEGLLTPFALSKLKRDILVLWNDEMVRNIALKLSDIKLAVPTRVHLRTVPLTSSQICDIDMWFMAMKWRDVDALLIIDVVARFTKDFTNQRDTDWTIAFFELRKFHVQNYNKENE